MKSIRHFFAARRFLATSLAACGLTIGLVAGAPAAHAGTGCTWAPISLENGWHSEEGAWGTGDPSVCLEADGMVYLSGSVTASSGSSTELGVLPVWDWPTRNLYFDVYTMGGSYGVLRIDSDGTMYAYGGLGGAMQYTSLAGISYPDAAVTQTDMPLENGWQSADSQWATGIPAYSITNDVVHLSGSMRRPAGTPVPESPYWAAAQVPWYAAPSDNCFAPDTYTYGGGIWSLSVDNFSGTVFGNNAQYTSLAGINYPAPGTMNWTAMPLLNGQLGDAAECNGPSYYDNGTVVYLNGFMNLPAGFNGEIAVLPPAERPSHFLYMIAFNEGTGSAPADLYDVLRIDPDGSMWILSPPNGSANFASLSGLSFHLGS
jgi:hypothetical protein